MARKKKDYQDREDAVKALLEQLKILDEEERIACVITDGEMNDDPDDPIRAVIDEALGDFLEIEDPFGQRYFFPVRNI
jgi:hypothetical protein